MGWAPSSSKASVLSMTAEVYRRTGGTFTPIGQGGQVKPMEPIRLQASDAGVGEAFSSAHFQVLDSLGQVWFNANAKVNIIGDAFLDISAPPIEGAYKLTVTISTFLFFRQSSETTFVVAVNAPAPPSAPPATGFGQFFGNVKTLALVGVAIAGIVVVNKVVSTVKQP